MSTVHYKVHSDNQTKPWLLLIHGLFGSLDNLSGLRKHFTADFQVLSIDLPDHGQSDTTQNFSFEHYAHLVVELLNNLQVTQVTIVGHSLGGKVAMQIALNHSAMINHLVVIDIAPVKYTARHTNVLNGLNNVPLQSIKTRKEADTALAQYVEDISTRQFLLKSLFQENQRWQWRFNLELLQRDYSKLSEAIISNATFTGPVLFIKGELSDYLLPEHRNAVVNLFPTSQSKVVNKTGHWLHAEKPELCAKIILNFLSKT